MLNKYQFNYNIYGEVIDDEEYKKLYLMYLIDSETNYLHNFCPKCDELIRNIYLDSHINSSSNCIINRRKILKKPKCIKVNIEKNDCKTKIEFN